MSNAFEEHFQQRMSRLEQQWREKEATKTTNMDWWKRMEETIGH